MTKSSRSRSPHRGRSRDRNETSRDQVRDSSTSTSYSNSESSGFSSLSRSPSPISSDDMMHRRSIPFHHETEPRHLHQPHTTSPQLTNIIHIENVSRNVTEDHLGEIFGRCGHIESIEYPRGYARITFGGENGELAAKRAIQFMNGGQLDGNVLVISLYQPPVPVKAKVEHCERSPLPPIVHHRQHHYPEDFHKRGDNWDRRSRESQRWNEDDDNNNNQYYDGDHHHRHRYNERQRKRTLASPSRERSRSHRRHNTGDDEDGDNYNQQSPIHYY